MYYGAFMNLSTKPCLVVGGGVVATRKILKLLDAGATVTVVSLKTTTQLSDLIAEHHVVYHKRAYDASLLAGIELAFAATDNRVVNAQVAADAKRRRIWCNVADDKALCDFIVPAIVRHQGVQLAISTEGQKPGVSKQLREAIEADLEDGGRRFYQILEELQQ